MHVSCWFIALCEDVCVHEVHFMEGACCFLGNFGSNEDNGHVIVKNQSAVILGPLFSDTCFCRLLPRFLLNLHLV